MKKGKIIQIIILLLTFHFLAVKEIGVAQSDFRVVEAVFNHLFLGGEKLLGDQPVVNPLHQSNQHDNQHGNAGQSNHRFKNLSL